MPLHSTSSKSAGLSPGGGSGPAGHGVEVSGVRRAFGDKVAIAGLDLKVALHGRLSIVGPSGCGKSTLLSMVSGLDEPDAGTIDVLGATTASERLARCAWMPQRDLLLPWRNVLDNACLALENRGVQRKEARERVSPLLERFGLGGFERLRPSQLSGGMRQRVSFLRTLVADKEVLLLDEPFGALDSITRADLQQWLNRALDADPRTTILVTHDVEEALLLGHQVIVMSARPGRVAARLDVDLEPMETRREYISRPGFIALRERVLEVLEAAS